MLIYSMVSIFPKLLVKAAKPSNKTLKLGTNFFDLKWSSLILSTTTLDTVPAANIIHTS